MDWPEPVEIRTPRLILRSARPDDLEAMHAVLSDPRATLWWSEPPHETLDESRTWLDAMIANGPDHPDFVIELDGRVIGKAGFWRLPDVGYILHPDCWGQGLASEAVGAAVEVDEEDAVDGSEGSERSERFQTAVHWLRCLEC